MEEKEKKLHEHHHIKVDAGQSPCRIDQFLVARLPMTTRMKVQRAIRQQGVYVGEKVIKCSYKVQPGDEIRILLPKPPPISQQVVPEDLPLDIVYEDDDVLLVNKAADMVVHPGVGNTSGTLVNAVLHHVQNLPFAPGNDFRPGLVHRIDLGTTGLVLLGKRELALQLLAKQFAERTIKRHYIALVWGDLSSDKGTINLPLAPSRRDFRIIMGCAPDTSLGKHAVTHYKVLERLGYVTLVSCRLETGRKHQIRAHFRHIGHPLFGDPKYGGDEVVKGQRFSKYKTFVENSFRLHPYQFLHAATLAFVHPTTQKEMAFKAPLPDPLAHILQRWQRYVGAIQHRM
ncbi:MAG: RluA family pseudouridine synthase [Cytophagales bacterium]